MPTLGRESIAKDPGRVPAVVAVALFVAVLTLVVAAPALQVRASATAAASGVPSFQHVYWIWMENHEYGSVAGSSSAPYENALAARFGLASNYYAIGHNSEMNYVNATAGQAGGVTDGNMHVPFASLFDQLEAAGISWHQYSQGYPGSSASCFTRISGPTGVVDGPGLAGQYVARHSPGIVYKAITGNAVRCAAHNSNLAGFDPAAARFEFITPNLCNDAHSCPLATGDAFLKAFVPRIVNSTAFANSLLVITYDEGTTSAGQLGDKGGHLYTIVASPWTHGVVNATYFDHWSLLRTVEDAWGLPCLAGACHRSNLDEFFPTGAGGGGSTPSPTITAHPTRRPTSAPPPSPSASARSATAPPRVGAASASPTAGLQTALPTAGRSPSPDSQTAPAGGTNQLQAVLAAAALIVLALAIWLLSRLVRRR